MFGSLTVPVPTMQHCTDGRDLCNCNGIMYIGLSNLNENHQRKTLMEKLFNFKTAPKTLKH